MNSGVISHIKVTSQPCCFNNFIAGITKLLCVISTVVTAHILFGMRFSLKY